MPTVAEYESKLERATAAGDQEAIDYFKSQIAEGTAMAVQSSAAGAGGGSPGGSGPTAEGEPPSAAYQRGNQSGNFLDTAYQGLTFGFGDELAGGMGGVKSFLQGKGFTPGYENTRDYVRGRVAREHEDNPWSAVASEIAGGLPLLAVAPFAGASGLRTAMGAGALYGAGAGEGGVGNRLTSAAGGAVGGALGHTAMRGLSALGRTLFPRAAPVSRMPEFQAQVGRLQDAGIPVTSAERIANPDARRAERIVSAFAGQTEGALERPVTLNRRLMELSNFAPEDVHIGELSLPAVQRARQRFTNDYDRLLAGVNVDLPAFAPFVQRIRNGYNQLYPHEQRAGVNRVIQDFEDAIAQQRPMSGRDYQRLRSGLGQRAFDAQKSDQNRYLAPVYRSLRYTLDSAFQRAAPRPVGRALRDLNRQYSGYKILQKAADNPEAIGTMANAARRNRGRLNPEFHDLLTSYQDVLLRKGFPTSQTPEGMAASHFFPPLMAVARAAGTRYGSAPFNDLRNRTGLNFPLPPNLGDFLLGQQMQDPQVADELQKAMGLSE
jgi:hypothetical protein